MNINEIATLSGYDFESVCRHHTWYAYLGNHLGLCRVLSKYKMIVDTRDIGVVPHLIMDGFWETWLTQCLASIVRPGDVCIDIGANFGYYSLLMSELSGAEGRTIAVEPNPAVAALLRNTEALHAFRFDIAEAAISDKNGSATLTIPVEFPGNASLINRTDKSNGVHSKVNVKTTSLDSLAKDLNLPKVDVVKIDVEGLEPQVFAGMRETIAGNPGIRIILEYSPFLYPDAASFTHQLFSGFEVNRIKDVEAMKVLDEADIDALLSLNDHTDLYLVRK